MEAWTAESSVKRYLSDHCISSEGVSVFRHTHRNKHVTDWDSYFNALRKKIRADNEQAYRNFVKAEMGVKRFRQGRYKRRPITHR